MISYKLTEIATKDGLIHQGAFYKPDKIGKTAILWVHGLTSSFYSDFEIFNRFCVKGRDISLGLASFNNRGHDMIAGLRQVDPKSPSGFTHANCGAGYEKFEDCIYDIDAGITFLADQGYQKIILIGHSTGAFKAGYYAGTVKDNRLSGVIVTSPISDRLIELKTNKKLAVNLRRMKHMVDKGKGDFLVNNLTFFPLTPRRYISLFAENSVEETIFDYGSEKPLLKFFRNIKTPLFVVLAENDEYADRSIREIKLFFDKHQRSVNYKSIIIKNAVHGFNRQEKTFARIVVSWLKSI
ncbi:hypothetical protein A2154_00625 [Candidatus Gottesmanbacteria bacterium RBG_16_43_7]|uniref:Serine aminopeptidase S33 domain-containing protein n=1 Tax=Candidatus Gottesmanbacteria bacterium RBG_16_43_7 TaxID=1798373 RepID=A0A1F5Z8X7_9BACT|nr:MAG: hypothetical protein A2154_00625 [Candidatus Gottesmanbacteria bacterium RBG_16_43_7]